MQQQRINFDKHTGPMGYDALLCGVITEKNHAIVFYRIYNALI